MTEPDAEVFEWASQFSAECPGHDYRFELEYPAPKRGPYVIPEVRRCQICGDVRHTMIALWSDR